MHDSELLTHAVKALVYRFEKATAGSAKNFGDFTISNDTRSPREIVNHMYDVATKAFTMVGEGHFNCPSPTLLDFDSESSRLLHRLEELQKAIETTPISPDEGKKLLQGPLLDMVTHVGQLAMLNGLNGNKIPKENYYGAQLK